MSVDLSQNVQGTIDQAASAKIRRKLAFMENVVPFLTSVTLHVVLIVGLYIAATIATTAVTIWVDHVKSQEQVIVPDADFVKGGEGGGIPNPGTGNSPAPDGTPFGRDGTNVGDGISKPLDPLLLLPKGGDSGDTPVTIGPSVNPVGGGDGNGEPKLIGLPGGLGIGPKGPYGKPGGNAKLVAFVADASGSMEQSGHFDDLRAELRKYVTQLNGVQRFNVIFFRETEAGTRKQYMAASERDLLIATPDKKAAALKFLDDTTPGFATDPRNALQAAFTMNPRPEVVWFLTDGDFDKTPGGNEAVVEFIRKLNTDKKIRVNTMLFFSVNSGEKGYQNELDRKKSVRAALERISQDSGGKFFDIHKNDMGN